MKKGRHGDPQGRDRVTARILTLWRGMWRLGLVRHPIPLRLVRRQRHIEKRGHR